MAQKGPEVKTITRDRLAEMFRNGEPFVLVDVLAREHFDVVHLPGAVNVPLPLVRELAPVLFGWNDTIIVYCSSFACHASGTAAKILTSMGFTDVLEYAGGIDDWARGELPLIIAPHEHVYAEEDEGGEDEQRKAA